MSNIQNQNPKIFTLKLNPVTGKYILPLNVLNRIQIGLPPGFDKTGLHFVASWSPTGHVSGLAETAPQLQPLDDLQRLYNAPRMIGSVEALGKRQGADNDVQKTLFVISEKLKKVEPTQTFKAETIRLAGLYTNLDKAEAAIKDNGSNAADNPEIRKFLNQQIECIREALDEHLSALAIGGREKSNVVDICRQKGVSAFCFNLLSDAKFNCPALHPLRRLLFRSKTLKGLKLTTQELRNEAILASHAKLLENSHRLISLSNSKAFEKLLKLKTDAQVNSFLLHGWVVIPVGDQAADVRECSLSTLSIRPDLQILWSFNSFLLELYLMQTPIGLYPDTWVGFMLPGFAHDPDFATSLKDQVEAAAKAAVIPRHMWDPENGALEGPFNYYGQPGRENRENLLKYSSTRPKIPAWKEVSSSTHWFDTVRTVHDDDPKFITFKQTAASRAVTTGPKKQGRVLVSSVLTKPSMNILGALKASKTFKNIADDVQNYLQGFRLARMQNAAAEMLYAYLQQAERGQLTVQGQTMGLDDTEEDNPFKLTT